MIYQSNYTSEGAAPVTITWKNWDGSILKTEKVQSGATPAYTGTPSYSNTYLPNATFTFDGWTPSLSAVEQDSIFTAKYNISGLPTGMSETISKSWDEIIYDAEHHNTREYELLSTKIMITTDGKPLCYELAGIGVDTLADGGTAGMTWIAKTIDGKCEWNTSDTNSGGYPASNYKTYLEGTCLNHFPANIKNAMKQVSKVCHSYDPDTTNMSYTAKVWPPSVHELNYTDDSKYETTGVEYTAYTQHSQRIRYDSSGSESDAWLSSAYSTISYYTCRIYSSGDWNYGFCSGEYGALPCFCLG